MEKKHNTPRVLQQQRYTIFLAEVVHEMTGLLMTQNRREFVTFLRDSRCVH